jgi:hypothetical protein
VRQRLIDVVERIERALERRVAVAPGSTDRLAATVEVLRKDYAVEPAADLHADRVSGLVDVFGLDDLDGTLLAVAVAPELDRNIALAFGLLRGAETPTRASVAVALEICGLPSLSPEGHDRLGPMSRLRRHRLVDVPGRGPWLERDIEVFDRVVAHLAGADALDPVLRSAVVPAVPLDLPAGRPVADALRAGALTWVRETPGAAGLSLAAGALASLGLGRLVIDLGRAGGPSALEEVVRSAVREAALRGVGLVVTGAERIAEFAQMDTFMQLNSAVVPVVLVGSRAWDPAWFADHPYVVDAPTLAPPARADAWRTLGGSAPTQGLETLRLTPESIEQTLGYAQILSTVDQAPVSEDLLIRAARVVGSSHGAGTRSRLGFGDLVVPDRVMEDLQRLVFWGRHRDEALARSRMFEADRKGSGIAALFSGSPGTGKTLSANVIAAELGLDLFQVNLSEIVDKYIGETEKNLERVFREAESLNVVLFFDEADALFGSRSEVKDAHDRYANQEVAYLLQRIEKFEGITLLTTNLRGNLDQAFTRRLQFIVHFPDPDEPTRRRLWELYAGRLDFLDAADPPDYDALARTFEFAGGDIRNVVLAAVYDATAAGTPLSNAQLMRAAHHEYRKLGRRLPT